MEFRILGQVELWAGSTRHDVGTRKARNLLAFLLCEPGNPVPAETLVSRIWGPSPGEGAAKSLHETVSRLRRKLREAGGTASQLTQRSGSYVLDVDRRDVDAWQFRALRDDARAAAAQGDSEGAIKLLAEAEALWHGIPLDGVEGGWAERARRRLLEEQLNARIDSIELRLRLGRYSELTGETADLAQQHPRDERLLALYLRALHGSGRQAEALEVFYQAERRRRRDLGGELGSALRDLHKRMLEEDPALSRAMPARAALGEIVTGVAPPLTPTSTMPRDNPDFTGRAAELAALWSWLDSEEARSFVPVAVIYGMAGVGKTAFAVHAAHQLRERYPEQVYVPLRANHADEGPLRPEIALGRVLHRLGVPDRMIPDDIEGRAELLRFTLSGRRVLIVLDDALDESQVRPLLPSVPGCLVLVTTRRRTLILPGILSLPLLPMPHADAEELFRRTAGERAQATTDQVSVSRLARLCGYVPQRIYFAGRQLRIHPAWSVGDLVSWFSDARPGDVNMTALLDFSYRYLTTDQQRLFRRLALHPGDTFSLHAAMAVGNVPARTTEHSLEVLLDYHLVEEPIPGRYEFHAVLRDYAKDHAYSEDSEEDRRLVLTRLLDYYLELLDRARSIVRPFSQPMTAAAGGPAPRLPPTRTWRECADLLGAEKSSLLAITRYAAAHGWQRHAAALAHLLSRFLDTWGDWADAADLHQRAVDACHDRGDPRGEATALTDLGYILCRTRQWSQARARLDAALAIARALGDTACEAAALDAIGTVQVWSDQYEHSLASYDEALSTWRQLGDRHGVADALSHGVLPTARLGRHRDALARAEAALASYRELGDLHGETKALNNLGGLQQDAHCYDDALISYEQAMAGFIQIGDRRGAALAINNVAEIRRLCGRYEEALKAYRSALIIFGEIGDRGSTVQAMNGMAAAIADACRPQDAIDEYEKALALGAELGERNPQVASHLGMGGVRLGMGRYPAAADDYRAALKLSQDIADPVAEGHALYGLGCAILPTGGPEAAREQWLAALARFEASGLPEADDVRARLSALGPTVGEGPVPLSRKFRAYGPWNFREATTFHGDREMSGTWSGWPRARWGSGRRLRGWLPTGAR